MRNNCPEGPAAQVRLPKSLRELHQMPLGELTFLQKVELKDQFMRDILQVDRDFMRGSLHAHECLHVYMFDPYLALQVVSARTLSKPDFFPNSMDRELFDWFGDRLPPAIRACPDRLVSPTFQHRSTGRTGPFFLYKTYHAYLHASNCYAAGMFGPYSHRVEAIHNAYALDCNGHVSLDFVCELQPGFFTLNNRKLFHEILISYQFWESYNFT